LTFAWQGFQSEIPEDWAPAVLSGSRREGYVRLAAPDVLSLQIRWKQSNRTAPRESDLVSYLARLERDSKRFKKPFRSSFQALDDEYRYSWTGSGNGAGAYFHLGDRAFFLEASATNNRSTHGSLQRFRSSFNQREGETERWQLLGLAIQIPTGAELSRDVLQSGRTRLEFVAPRTSIFAERWGFGAQIVARHSLADWSKETAEMKSATVTEVERGLHLQQSGLKPTEALVEFDPTTNQIRLLKVSSRQDRWKPQWDWLI
jgi:hypothetical protein